MDVYGLTGGIGSGKSAVAELLEDFGVPVVSADELSRVVVARGSRGLGDVVEAFGPEVLDDSGELDRRKMAGIVFREPARRQQLEAILHPRIRERFEQVLDALEKAGHTVAIYEVPLLFEKNLQSEMKAVILVTAREEIRVRRVMDRDDVTETEVRGRMAAQMDESLKRKRADYIIENEGTRDALRREVQFLLDRFVRLDARHTPETAVAPVPSPMAATAGGTVIAPIPTAPPSRTPTQIPIGGPKPAPPGALPSSVSTLPPVASRRAAPPPPTPSPPPGNPAAPPPGPSSGGGLPTPPPGTHIPTPRPGSLQPSHATPTAPLPAPDDRSTRPTENLNTRRTEPAIPIDAVREAAAQSEASGSGRNGAPNPPSAPKSPDEE